MHNVFLAIYCCVAPYTAPLASTTLTVDLNTAMVESSTAGVVMNVQHMTEDLNTNVYESTITDPTPQVDDWQWMVTRARSQGLVFDSNGNAKILLKVSTPVQFPVLWTRAVGFPRVIPSTATFTDPSLHWVISQSTQSLANYITARKKNIGDTPTVYWGDEYDYRFIAYNYVGPK